MCRKASLDTVDLVDREHKPPNKYKENAVQVTVSELRKVCEKIFDHLEAMGYSRVEISHEYYWDIPQESRYDPYQEPQQFTLGQLTDDLSELQRIARNDSEPLAYAFVWLATVIRAIGEEVVR